MAISKTGLQLRWLGVAGFEFKTEKNTLLIDPFLTRPPLRYIFRGRVESNQKIIADTIKKANHILVTHAHYDHLMDVPEIARQTGATVFGSPNVYWILRAFQVSERQIRIFACGEALQLPYASIVSIPARHPPIPGYLSGKLRKDLIPPLRLRDFRMDTCFSYLIKTQNIKLLIWSSISTQFARPADILFMRAVANKRWYERILSEVRPKLVIPTHWDDLFHPSEGMIKPFWSPPKLSWPPITKINLEDFKKNIQQIQPDCAVLIPEIFKPYHLMDEMNS